MTACLRRNRAHLFWWRRRCRSPRDRRVRQRWLSPEPKYVPPGAVFPAWTRCTPSEISITATKRSAFVQRGFCGGCAPQKPLIRFYVAFEGLFPDLQGQRDETRTFWKLCRHGLLHRSTFNGPGIYLVRDLNTPVVVNRGDPANIVFHLDPVAFAQKVLATISGDFEVYATSLTSPLPTVSPLNETRGNSASVLPFGTGLPPQPHTDPFPESLRKILLE